MEAPIKVLFAEDDVKLARLTAQYLEGSGCEVEVVGNGPDAIALASRRAFDVVLLDLMLPGKDGVAVCRELRTRLDVPIIMVTARREEADRVIGLEAGADDYVTKPFSSRELVARIQANVRRARGLAGPPLKPVIAGAITLDPGRMRVTVAGREIALTSYEFAILKVLAERPGRVLRREQLLELATGSADDAFERSIDIHISRLRQKLGDDAKQPRYLRTVRGVGYVLAVGDEP
ncbi:MAG: response regulator transcription factor [Deltaproteobacteria bacterium]|nr:response regulator transcription factor [Deltaproteobacteria bacterium]